MNRLYRTSGPDPSKDRGSHVDGLPDDMKKAGERKAEHERKPSTSVGVQARERPRVRAVTPIGYGLLAWVTIPSSKPSPRNLDCSAQPLLSARLLCPESRPTSNA